MASLVTYGYVDKRDYDTSIIYIPIVNIYRRSGLKPSPRLAYRYRSVY